MILEVVQSKWSLTWYDPLGPRMCVLELMNGHVLQTLREQLKIPGSRLEGSELLTNGLNSNHKFLESQKLSLLLKVVDQFQKNHTAAMDGNSKSVRSFRNPNHVAKGN